MLGTVAFVVSIRSQQGNQTITNLIIVKQRSGRAGWQRSLCYCELASERNEQAVTSSGPSSSLRLCVSDSGGCTWLLASLHVIHEFVAVEVEICSSRCCPCVSSGRLDHVVLEVHRQVVYQRKEREM